jgi:hypothetical protein
MAGYTFIVSHEHRVDDKNRINRHRDRINSINHYREPSTAGNAILMWDSLLNLITLALSLTVLTVVSGIHWFDLDIRGCGDSHGTVRHCRNYLRKKTVGK